MMTRGKIARFDGMVMTKTMAGVSARNVLALAGFCVATPSVTGSPAFTRGGPDARAAVEIAFDFTTRQPIVPVKVNGGPPVPFVIDTGASIHVVDSEIAGRAGTVNRSPREMAGGGESTVHAEIAEPLTFEAGGLRWPAQRAAVVNLGYGRTKHFAGLIGAPVLMRYTVQFDFAARSLRLLDSSSYTPPAGAVRVPFELQEDLPIVHATVDAGSGPVDARLMVDTGASQFVDLNRPFVDAHRLADLIPNAAPRDRPAALGGTAPFLYGTARRFILGGIVFDRPVVGLSRARTGSSSRSDRDGIIGNDLLRHFTVTVDYGRDTLVLEKSSGR